MKIKHTDDYRRRRAMEYPALTELADALVHERNGDPTKLEAYIKACREVKERYPKLDITPQGKT